MTKPYYDDPLPLYRRRTVEYDFALWQTPAMKKAATLALADTVRFKVYTAPNAVPSLDLYSGSRLAGGSGIEILTRGDADTNVPAKVRITFGQADVAALALQTYEGELLWVDADSTNPATAARPIAFGKVVVRDTALGATAL